MKSFICMFIVLMMLSGCASKQSVELISSSVEIRDDRSGGVSITSGDKKGEIIEPISLSYDFVLKNTGKKVLGGMEKINSQTFEYNDGIKVYIEPNEKLQEVTTEVMGFNMYDEEDRQQAGLGMGITGTPVLEQNQEGKYTLDFVLGALEENPEIRIAPSSEQLNKLKRNSLDALVIIHIADEEIARFDLKNPN
ncbi:hypothetical protein ACFPYN_02785 [Paenisporosarcina macmurdoensis]|uniref:Lipoprotein n=1 Tax=Paenisporosarcina macmurdoensis TaxID=212659 RepID=A0ABW1L5I8_9BACL